MTQTIPRLRSRVRIAREEYALSPRTFTGLVRGRPGPCACDADLGEQVGKHRPVVSLPGGDDYRERSPSPVDGVVDLRGQPATRASDPVTCRFTGSPGRVLVIRPSPPWRSQAVSYSSRADGHG